ncbi:MAG: tRNA lysidine(34) synthetase TilS [Ruminococcus sp.]|nr:tRNA lysidine(34) synthetase TilS [Ruminococcus sp.]
MNKIVLKTISDHKLLSPSDKVIVALSGGADSVSLLYVLLSLREELGISIMAAHVNHRLRGEESDRDERFVRKLCEELSVELFVRSEDVGELSRQRGMSMELCGRDVRYEFFSELSRTHGAKVATAHTMSDAEETMLYNIARGTTLHGLCSIPYKRDYIIRPLLDCTRQQIEEYCSGQGLSFVQDSTNFSEDVCSRNKIRLSVLPPLSELSEGFHRSFSRLRSQLSQVDEFMNLMADEALEDCRCDGGLSADKLCALHDAVLGYALSQYISMQGGVSEYRHISLCKKILTEGGAVTLPGGLTAVCRQGIFRVAEQSDTEVFEAVRLTVPMTFQYAGAEYSFEELLMQDIINRKLASDCIPCDIISEDTIVRTRGEGDRFALLRRGITKPLRKLQNELKIPAYDRDRSLVIAIGNTVLWAEGIGVSEQGKLPPTADKGIYINVRRRKI